MPSVNLGSEEKLGDGVYIGTGAIVLLGFRIGRNAVVGSGSVVTKDVPKNMVVKVIPARES